jgi:hypothetical protein
MTDRQQEIAEPLLYLADAIGGDWPQRTRVALTNLFISAEHSPESIQLLSDVRNLFLASGNPERLSTEDLLIGLHELDGRPWKTWSNGEPLTSIQFATLLRKFGAYSKNINAGGKKTQRGYQRSDFQAAWNCHLPPLRKPASTPVPEAAANSASIAPCSTQPAVADASVYAGDSGIAGSREISATPAPKPDQTTNSPSPPAAQQAPEPPRKFITDPLAASLEQRPMLRTVGGWVYRDED